MMKFFYTITIILFSQFLTYSQTSDNYEPNDDFTQAYNSILCNQIDLTISNSDIDIFSYDLTTEEISINLINVSNAITPKVTVYDNSYTELNSWTGNSGQNLYNTFTPPSSGLYYVKIEDIGSNIVLEPYNLILTDPSCPLSSEAEILAYNIPDQVSSEIFSANDSIHVTMPYGTDITSLTSDFTLSDYASATVGTTPQVSGSTSNNWTDNPVIYTITAQNGTTNDWSVYINIEQNSEAEILTFDIPNQINSEIFPADDSVHVFMPGGTNITDLIAEFTLSAGAETKVGSTIQVSGSSSNNWSDNPVIYTVTAENGTNIIEWSVYVDVAEGIDNINDDVFSVYPNPAEGEFYIKLNVADSKDIKIEIIDMQGKIIKKIDSKNIAEVINCDLKKDSSGIYFIKVLFKNEIFIKKLSIIR